jgi:hypothetical protein
MGGGSWNTGRYTSAKTTRINSGIDDFAYSKTATTTHTNLDPARIAAKPFTKLESRDSDEHPESNPVLVCFDVTGSNRDRAVVAQKRLPNLMDLLNKYLTDPQVAVAANDDFKVEGVAAVQISDFESDNRVDDHIRSIRLIGNGGGNNGESYDLILYAAARKCVLDSVEKRGKKGYMFMYADEPIFPEVLATEVREVFGDVLEKNIPIAEIIEEARRNFNIFLLWPVGGEERAREQYVKLFGEESVITLEHPNVICELIASTIGLYENKVTATSVVTDLVAVGVPAHEADAISRTLVVAAATSSALAPAGGGRAARL